MTTLAGELRSLNVPRGGHGMPSPTAASAELDDELRQLIHDVKTTRRTVKGQLGQARLTNQFLAALEERLHAFQARLELTAKEAQNHEHDEEDEED